MKIYISAVKKNERIDVLYELGVRNFLFSYEDKKVINQIQYMADSLEQPCTILVDSGAFSAWNRGLVIDIDHYIEFIETVKGMATHHTIYFIGLDVIPHEKGKGRPTLERVRASAMKGIENWHYIKSKGHATIQTYHQFEDTDILDIILKECNELNYIGISPANDQSVKSRNRWLEDVFYHIRDTTRTHVLGLTAHASMEKFPAYSADSSSWLNAVKFGELFNDRDISKPGRTQHLERNNIFYHDPKMEFFNSILYYMRLERYITKLWAQRGIKWNS